MFLMLLWLGAIAGMWIVVISGARRQSTPDTASSGLLILMAILFGAIPPTVICFVSTFVLFQAAPTVQFNAGSSYATTLWSFWVHAWPALFLASGFLAVGYFFWLLIALAVHRNHWTTFALFLSFLSTAIGWFLLSNAFPSA
ncbi:MAG: hypothetical protein RBS80_10075 [Thermoguttaceae bacterium]|jgi:hypothetical protein|nr:hypothetical protein [Thermoguttaceae bacterium]